MPHKRTLILTAILLSAGAAALLAQPAARDANSRPPKAPPAAAPKAPADANRLPADLTEQQVAELMTVLEEKRPEEAAQLKRIKEENPRDYPRALGAAWRNYLVWRDMPPEVQKAQETLVLAKLEAWRVSREYLAAKNPIQKDRLHARLMGLLGEEFDAEQTVREYRLSQLEEQLRRVRAELKERSNQRAQMIERDAQELLAAKIRPDGVRPLEAARGRGNTTTTRPASRPAE
jgi:hypothetical protein